MNKTVDHWIAVADTLKQQRDQAEKERDDWKRKCLEEACAHDKTRRAWGEEVADMRQNAMRDGSEFGSLLSERDALRAERDALRKVNDAARTLVRTSFKVHGYDQYTVRANDLECLRAHFDASMEAKV
jgi:hypothetical protein